jgi:hypothetical protein
MAWQGTEDLPDLLRFYTDRVRVINFKDPDILKGVDPVGPGIIPGAENNDLSGADVCSLQYNLVETANACNDCTTNSR